MTHTSRKWANCRSARPSWDAGRRWLPCRARDSQDKKRSIFRKIRPDHKHRRCNYRGPSDKAKIERLRHETINADSYTKRAAGRRCCNASATKYASWPGAVDNASTCAPPFAGPSPGRGGRLRHPCPSDIRAAPLVGYPSRTHLNLLPRPIAVSHQIHTCTPNSSNKFTTICGSNILKVDCAQWRIPHV